MQLEINELYNLKAVEVSIVPEGANNQEILVMKENQMKVDFKILDQAIKKAKLKDEAKILKILEDGKLESQDQELLMAAMKLLAAVNASPETIAEIQAIAGMSAPVEKTADDMAEKMAGIEKENETLKASVKTKDDEIAALKAAADAPKVNPFPVTKEGDLDVTGIPEALQPTIKALWEKSKTDSEALKKVTKALDDERDMRITKEYEDKASEFKNLPIKKESLGKVLKEIGVKLPAIYGDVEAVLKSVNEVAKESPAFKEVGASGAGEKTASNKDEAYEKIVAKAKEHPSCKGMKRAKAVDHFITNTDEGRKMYNEYATMEA